MCKTLSGTPRGDGFRMPAEFENHDGCWMIWPERADNWRWGAKPAQKAFADVAAAIAASEPVNMAVSAEQFQNARQLLDSRVRVVEMSNNDAWMRDCGPTFVVDGDGGMRGVDWKFNAWGGLEGGLYFPWDKDDQVARKVIEIEGCDRYRAPIVLEGGSIHVDGEGTLLVTAQCLLNKNRNPELSQGEIEDVLKAYLNVQTVIWLPKGVYNDETDGHVDNLCCFVRPGEVLLSWTDDESDPQYAISSEAQRILTQAVDARGRKLKIHKIHQPGPIFISDEESRGVDAVDGTLSRLPGDRLAGSYVNFYIARDRIVFPLLDARYDDQARDTLVALFPEREVVGVDAREILLGGGNIHCITQQVPAHQG